MFIASLISDQPSNFTGNIVAKKCKHSPNSPVDFLSNQNETVLKIRSLQHAIVRVSISPPLF